MINNDLKITKIKTLKKLYSTYEIYKYMYPNMSEQEFQEHVKYMFKNGVQFICMTNQNKMIGITAYWIAVRLHSGKYLQIDSLVVHPQYRGQKLGLEIIKYLENIARKENAQYYVLDVYTENHKALKLYSQDGFKIRGYHMMKNL